MCMQMYAGRTIATTRSLVLVLYFSKIQPQLRTGIANPSQLILMWGFMKGLSC